ncbi:MAG: tetratricopeptide repeat protein [Bacteroidetes bacterium]|nr:tetratricopeptide repeat protein [Bacteroidota bacterium]
MKKALAILFLLLSPAVFAQQSEWPTPEVEQMYKNAKQYLMAGDLRQAIITYQQAINLAPEKMVLYRDLAQAYYLAGGYDDALKIIEPLMKSGDADEQTYQVKAACLIAAKENKKAKTVIQEGMKRYPHSGMLYHEMSKMYEADEDLPAALRSLLDGIRNDPAYHVNYYDAARLYMGTKKPIWAVIYAEIFLNIEQHTPRADETRDMLLGAYMRLYNSLGTGKVQKYKDKKAPVINPNDFENAVALTYLKLSPIVSDGINTENLIMLRTRFLIEWFTHYSEKYPFTMFKRMDNMLRNGYFDAYNQWVFGKIDNPQVFEAWKNFHAEALPALEKWLEANPYHPVAGDFYNNKKVDDIFIKEEKKGE